MDFSGKHVVVTGGTGALGTAVVGSLLAAGATCTVPYVHEAEAQRFPHRGDAKVKLIAVADLADEALVAKVYDGLKLWASIHIAGGFAPGKVAETGQTALMAQINGNLVSCFLCCRAAVNAMAAGGRIVNVAARPALEWLTEPAWQPIRLRKRASPRSPWCWRRKWRKTAFWSTRWRPRSWTQPPIARRCRRPTLMPGRRSRKWRRRSCSSPRPTTALRAGRSCRCTGNP